MKKINNVFDIYRKVFIYIAIIIAIIISFIFGCKFYRDELKPFGPYYVKYRLDGYWFKKERYQKIDDPEELSGPFWDFNNEINCFKIDGYSIYAIDSNNFLERGIQILDEHGNNVNGEYSDSFYINEYDAEGRLDYQIHFRYRDGNEPLFFIEQIDFYKYKDDLVAVYSYEPPFSDTKADISLSIMDEDGWILYDKSRTYESKEINTEDEWVEKFCLKVSKDDTEVILDEAGGLCSYKVFGSNDEILQEIKLKEGKTYDDNDEPVLRKNLETYIWYLYDEGNDAKLKGYFEFEPDFRHGIQYTSVQNDSCRWTYNPDYFWYEEYNESIFFNNDSSTGNLTYTNGYREPRIVKGSDCNGHEIYFSFDKNVEWLDELIIDEKIWKVK